MDYTVVSDYELTNLRDTVKILLGIGWVLQGGISVSHNDSVPYYYQALVKNF